MTGVIQLVLAPGHLQQPRPLMRIADLDHRLHELIRVPATQPLFLQLILIQFLVEFNENVHEPGSQVFQLRSRLGNPRQLM